MLNRCACLDVKVDINSKAGQAYVKNKVGLRDKRRQSASLDSLDTGTRRMSRDSNMSDAQVAQISDGHSDISPRFCMLAASAVIADLKKWKSPLPIEYHHYSIKVENGRQESVKLLTDEIGNKYAGLMRKRIVILTYTYLYLPILTYMFM